MECWQPDCDCGGFVVTESPAPAPEQTPDARDPGYVPRRSNPRACSICKCEGYTGAVNGICKDCGHKFEYHQGAGATVDPLGLGQEAGAGHAAS